jgi:hypothetical protein
MSEPRAKTSIAPAAPLATEPHLVLVDLRRRDGRKLLQDVMGLAVFGYCFNRSEPYVAAVNAFGGALRAHMSVDTPAQLTGFVNHVRAMELAPRISYAVDPAETSRVMASIGAAGAGRA